MCDSPAKYDDLMVDGYFQVWKTVKINLVQKLTTLFEITVIMLMMQEVIKAEELPDEENEIILNQVFSSIHRILNTPPTQKDKTITFTQFKDGSWNPVPKDEEAERLRKEKEAEEKKNEVNYPLNVETFKL